MPSTLSDHEVKILWQRAQERLELVDTERPITFDEVDNLLKSVGRRPANQTVVDWIKSAASQSSNVIDIVSTVVVPFDSLKHQFTPVVEFVRLAADDAGREVPLPGKALEDEQGRFRLEVIKEKRELVIKITALGNACDDYAGMKVGLATPGREPIAIIELDEDGDGEIRLADTTDLRLLLLRPVIGTVQDV
jgi:hypothetical protein